jgi:hypothetical protein
MSNDVFPAFPSEPDLDDTFSPEGNDSVWTYTSQGWVKTVIVLQDKDAGYPIWGGRIIDIANGAGGSGSGGGGG